jgi:DNA polymerase-3 subunit beta
MKFTISQENLKNAVNLTSRFITNKVQLPILCNVLLKANKTSLNLQATNLENSVSLNVPSRIEKEGEITVNGKLLSDLVSNLGSGTVEVEVDKEQIIITKDSFKSKLLGINSSDFPKLPTSLSKDTIKIDFGKFKESLSRCLFCVSNDDTRPILTGVLFVSSNIGCFLVSTDGFRLTEIEIKLEEKISDFKVVIPKAILNEISKIEEEKEIEISIDKENNQILFQVGNILFSSRLIEGEFPDYKKIIPTTNLGTIKTEKDELEKAVKLASIFARDSGNIVKFKVEKEKLKVIAESSKSGDQETEVEIKKEDFEKEEFEIMFNYRFIEESLKNITADEVIINFSDNNKATKLLDPKNKNFLHIIMPIKNS